MHSQAVETRHNGCCILCHVPCCQPYCLNLALPAQEGSSLKALPRPGKYTGDFTVTVHNAGGAQHALTLHSETYRYTAVHGPPVQLQLPDFPLRVLLATPLPSVNVLIKDGPGNFCTSTSVPAVTFSSDNLQIEIGERSWRMVDGMPKLELSNVVVRPQQALAFPSATARVKCSAELRIMFGSTPLVQLLTFDICPGTFTSLVLTP